MGTLKTTHYTLTITRYTLHITNYTSNSYHYKLHIQTFTTLHIRGVENARDSVYNP